MDDNLVKSKNCPDTIFNLTHFYGEMENVSFSLANSVKAHGHVGTIRHTIGNLQRP